VGVAFITMILIYIPSTHRFRILYWMLRVFFCFVCFFWGGEFNSLFVVISITDSSGVILLLSFVMIRISNRIGSLSPPAIRVYFNLRMD